MCADTGASGPAPEFVSALGASNYTYAEPTFSQSLPDRLGRTSEEIETIASLADD